MPHAEQPEVKMATPAVNGNKTNSITLDHITSYPLVADGLSFYQQNPLGARSIALANSAYSKFAVPFLPYLETPYHYVHPYLAKADTLGDDTLTRVDSHFPALKSTDYVTLKSSAWNAAYFPFRVAGEGRDYVFKTYDDEYQKTAASGEMPLLHTGKAVLSTELRIASDAMHAFAEWIGPKKDHAVEKVQHHVHKGHAHAVHAKQAAAEKSEAILNNKH